MNEILKTVIKFKNSVQNIQGALDQNPSLKFSKNSKSFLVTPFCYVHPKF